MRFATLAPLRSSRVHAFAAAFALACTAFAAAAPAAHAVTLGLRDRFSDGTVGNWQGGTAASNPGTGGVDGLGDGYLQLSVAGPFAGNLGNFSTGPQYVGNWTAAGVTEVRLSLKDVGAPDNLEMHVCLGNGVTGNFWQSNVGLIPPASGWQEFHVEVTNAANFSFIGSGVGNFATALQSVDRLLIRHDKAPYVKAPDAVIGDVGIDEVYLTNGIAGIGNPLHTAAGSPVRMAPAAPNPSRGGVSFRMEAPAGEAVHVQVVDAAGRVVRRHELTGADGGVTWTWDGADDRGIRMAPGYYRARAWSRFGGMSQPIVRVN